MSTTACSTAARPALDEVFDRLPQPALVVDRETIEVIALNRAAARLLGGRGADGAADDGIVGTGLASHLASAPASLARDLALAAGGKRLSLQVGAAGRPIAVEVTVAPAGSSGLPAWALVLRPEDRTTKGFSELNIKMLEAKKLALQRQRAELEATADRLTRANADLEHFTHIAAHDLREPCRRQAALIIALREDLGDDLDGEVDTQLDLIERNSAEMLSMIDGLRVLANLAGPTLELSTVDLAELVDGLVEALVPGDGRSRVDTSLPREIECYAVLVTALFRNLIDNAVRHGGRPLRLDVSAAVADDGRTWYRVANNAEPDAGLGSDPLVPFVRGRRGGSGIGLSICNRVVQHHRGHIRVERTDEEFIVHFTLERTGP